MATAVIPEHDDNWLLIHGPQQLELLLRAIVFHPGVPIVITDDERASRDVSVGTARLLGLPREQIIGQKFDNFAEPSVRTILPQIWDSFLQEGKASGTLKLSSPDGDVKSVAFEARRDVLPVRHLLVLQPLKEAQEPPSTLSLPGCVRDFALCLLDPVGEIAAWYGGSERIYGYPAEDAVGRSASALYPEQPPQAVVLQQTMARALAEGY